MEGFIVNKTLLRGLIIPQAVPCAHGDAVRVGLWSHGAAKYPDWMGEEAETGGLPSTPARGSEGLGRASPPKLWACVFSWTFCFVL